MESPLIQELLTKDRQETLQACIVAALVTHLRDVPPDLVAQIRLVKDIEKLRDLHNWAMVCPDLAAFQARLRS